MTEHIQGTEGIMALVNIALLTGNIGKPGSGINPLRGQNNVQDHARFLTRTKRTKKPFRSVVHRV